MQRNILDCTVSGDVFILKSAKQKSPIYWNITSRKKIKKFRLLLYAEVYGRNTRKCSDYPFKSFSPIIQLLTDMVSLSRYSYNMYRLLKRSWSCLKTGSTRWIWKYKPNRKNFFKKVNLNIKSDLFFERQSRKMLTEIAIKWINLKINNIQPITSVWYCLKMNSPSSTTK